MSEVPDFDPVAAAAEIEAARVAQEAASRLSRLNVIIENNLEFFEKLDEDMLSAFTTGDTKCRITGDPSSDVIWAIREKYDGIGFPVKDVGTNGVTCFYIVIQ